MNYKVFKNGIQIKTRSCKIYPKPYNFESSMEYVMFPIVDKTEIVIESETEIKSAVIRPLSSRIPFTIKDGKIIITVCARMKISVEINGSSKNNLMIFAHEEKECNFDKYENHILIRNDKENTGTLKIDKDNTLVYFEEDAVLQGNIYASNCKNLMICGFGRICMERYTYEMRKDFARGIDIFKCENIKIQDIIIDDSNDWSMRINGCDNAEVNNVKIFGCRGNSDGIDVCGSRNVTVSDIFTRVWDDSFVVKSLGTGNTENIIFKDSVLWNDFARPMEIGVELRADEIKNIKFENIDVIHSTTGYPIMGIHHGDHAIVSDITFENIRIEETPGAQLFDMRIADSVWSRDTGMGKIRDITFSNIEYIGERGDDILLSNSRIDGFSGEHDIQNISFHNIKIKGKTAKTSQAMGLDIGSHAERISITSSGEADELSRASCDVKMQDEFTLMDDGFFYGIVSVRLVNNTSSRISGQACLAVSPKNMAAEQNFAYDLSLGEETAYSFNVKLQPGKYVFYLKTEQENIENKWLYQELDAVIYEGKGIKNSPLYRIVNYYNTNSVGIRLAADNDNLLLMSESENQGSMDFVLYTALPVPIEEGEVMFSAEETDFGEVCAVINKENSLTAAPQLRCPAEITYVFRNEPKVKKIIKTQIRLNNKEIVSIPFDSLGFDRGCGHFLMEIAAKEEETLKLRYPYTLFHSTMPEKTAHMFGNVKIKRN